MILCEVNFFSEVLVSSCSMNILLPQQPLALAQANNRQPAKVLYLLHGSSGDHTRMLRLSSIERYVEGLNVAVVMPDVQSSFCIDMAHGGKFFTFMTEEVPAVVHSLFTLSKDRKDTFVAGVSMGGYGAFKLALCRPDQYAAAASLSGTLDMCALIEDHKENNDQYWLGVMETMFEDMDKVSGSSDDLFAQAQKISQSTLKPRLFQCCGTEDFLYGFNSSFRDYASSLDLDYTYEEGPGEHSWDFWEGMLQKALHWMHVI